MTNPQHDHLYKNKRKDLQLKKLNQASHLIAPLALLSACGGEDSTATGSKSTVPALTVKLTGADGSSPQYFMTFSADLDANNSSDVIVLPGNYPPRSDTKFNPVVALIGDNSAEIADTGYIRGYVHAREAIAADFNNDGILDLFIAAHGYDANPFPGEPNGLLLSDGDAQIIDASNLLPSESDFTHSAAVSDVNGDGFVDIFVGNIGGGFGVNPYLLVNNGGTSFIRTELDPNIFSWTQPTSVTNKKYTSSLFHDVDGDGVEELILGMDTGSKSLILEFNTSKNDFDIVRELPAGIFGQNSITVDVQAADVNSDGLIDIIMSQTNSEPFYSGRAIQILLQKPDGTFEDQGTDIISDFNMSGEWIVFIGLFDVNNDGAIDIVGTLGSGGYLLFLNDGNGRFTDTSKGNKISGSETYQVAIDYAGENLFGVNIDGRMFDIASSGELNVVQLI